MAKLKKPLLSLEAIGSLAKSISFRRSRGKSISEKKPEVPDSRTLAQLSWRHMYQKAVALWQALSAAEKQEWESLARPKHMTGFAWFISQALKPNPGLYLPLQGGKMAGDIDMDGNKIENLPDPVQDQEPVTRKYFQDNLPPGGYTEGCKVHRTTPQSIPHNTTTYLSFDAEDYDTDVMHDLVVDPDRITIKTAGIYLVQCQVHFEINAVARRRVTIHQNGFNIARQRSDGQVNTYTCILCSTLWQCSVGMYLRVSIYQDSGVALDIMSFSSYSPHFQAQRIG